MFKSIEFNRKLVHLSSLTIPILYYYIGWQPMLIILSILFILIVLWDVLRIKNKWVVAKFSNPLFIRSSENNRLSGAVYFLLSCLIGIILFNKYVFIVSISILIICDTMAAFIGINFGKIKIFNKSLEGIIAFFLSGLIVIITLNFLFNQPLMNKALFISLVLASIAELLSNTLKINDNLLIMLVFGCSYYIIL